ncbi:ribosomal L18p/L5e family protein [Tanacetum coccineum]
MASSTEQEFIPHYKSKLTTFPRSHKLWDAKIASRIGEKLGARLNDVGVIDVEIDVDVEMARLESYRKRLGPFLRAVQETGVRVIGSDKLQQ